MKRILLTAVYLTLTAAPALATERYASLAAGAWFPGRTTAVDFNFRPVDATYSPGWTLGGAAGVAYDNGFRLENELTYRQAPAKGAAGDMWAWSWMINAWWDGRNSSPVTPYFGGGFGAARAHVASPGPVDSTGSGAAYQVGGGFDVRIDPRLSLDLGYRYFVIADAYNRGIGKADLGGSSFSAGAKMRF